MRFVLNFIFLLLVTFSALAQDKHSPAEAQEWHKRIDAIHVAFLTDRLKLTPDEAQKFWPVYNRYQKETDALNDQRWKNRETNKDFPDKALTVDLAIDQKLLDTKKKYQIAFQHVVSTQKVLSLYTAEKDFREYLMQQLHNRDNDKRKDGDKK